MYFHRIRKEFTRAFDVSWITETAPHRLECVVSCPGTEICNIDPWVLPHLNLFFCSTENNWRKVWIPFSTWYEPACRGCPTSTDCTSGLTSTCLCVCLCLISTLALLDLVIMENYACTGSSRWFKVVVEVLKKQKNNFHMNSVKRLKLLRFGREWLFPTYSQLLNWVAASLWSRAAACVASSSFLPAACCGIHCSTPVLPSILFKSWSELRFSGSVQQQLRSVMLQFIRNNDPVILFCDQLFFKILFHFHSSQPLTPPLSQG